MAEKNERRQHRIEKLQALRNQGLEPYPVRAEYTHTNAQAVKAFDETEQEQPTVRVVGRLMSIRNMGRSTFAHIADGSGQIQLYLRQDVLGEEYDRFGDLIDVGDFVAAEGSLFRTRTGEITVRVEAWRPLCKTLRQLPEKWHGLRDVETRYRQRYLDLIANEDVRRIFVTRTRIVSALRSLLDEQGFLEVETPILQPIYGGASARPFTTHHNALDTNLYLRIADELYLKRLIVGGFDRVYEIGHDFRNEGLSSQHNPEFTMAELYQAYADYRDMMDLVENLYSQVAEWVLRSTQINYQGEKIELAPPWQRITMREAILDRTGIDIKEIRDHAELQRAVEDNGLHVDPQPTWGKLVEELFEEYVQPGLIQPTIIMDFPLEVSPLAKKKPDEPGFVERFEFFIAGLECGNAFSELNDPLDQRERFAQQARAQQQGDDEAQPLDEDFLLALEHGMPPTGGMGFGIDRMTMLFTDQSSIREVILFPLLRPQD